MRRATPSDEVVALDSKPGGGQGVDIRRSPTVPGFDDSWRSPAGPGAMPERRFLPSIRTTPLELESPGHPVG